VNRQTRKGLGAILAGVGVAMMCGVMTAGGVVLADVDEQDPIVPDDPNAESTAEVTMKERCIWYVTGVASSITLEKTSDEEDEVYDGDKYSLSADLDDYIAWTSGNLSGGGSDYDDHAPCTFFGEQTGIEITGAWEDTTFEAEAQNTDEAGTDVDDSANMGFFANDTDPLSLNIAEGTCRALGAWTIGPDIVAHEDPSGSILDLTAAAATPIPDDAALSNDKCNATISVTASIPAGQTPLYAGKAYRFTGPTFTTEISIDTVRP
jgi:hypothetical protein